MKNHVRGICVRGHNIIFYTKKVNSQIQGGQPPENKGGKKMKCDSKQIIVRLLQELKNSGIRYEDLASGLFLCERTIRNYSKGKIPDCKIIYVLTYIKNNYMEIYENVLSKE